MECISFVTHQRKTQFKSLSFSKRSNCLMIGVTSNMQQQQQAINANVLQNIHNHVNQPQWASAEPQYNFFVGQEDPQRVGIFHGLLSLLLIIIGWLLFLLFLECGVHFTVNIERQRKTRLISFPQLWLPTTRTVAVKFLRSWTSAAAWRMARWWCGNGITNGPWS